MYALTFMRMRMRSAHISNLHWHTVVFPFFKCSFCVPSAYAQGTYACSDHMHEELMYTNCSPFPLVRSLREFICRPSFREKKAQS
jgi:hypothetical protein